MFNDKNKYQRSDSKGVAYLPKYESGSTIRSNEEENCFPINVPNYSVYSSGQNNEDEKVLINKAELKAFAQCFAQEKISLENMAEKLANENCLIIGEVQKLRHENDRLKAINESISNQNTTQYYQAVESLKSKLKQQFEKRLQAERELHGIEAVVFELKKKNQFLSDKLKYQQDQVQRCEQLLKIKQDIIQNFEWQKANSARNRHKQTTQQTRGNKQKHVQSSLSTKHQMISKHKQVNSEQEKRSQQIKIKTEINQTLDLSEINFNEQSKMNQTDFIMDENVNLNKKLPKYIINKRSSQNQSKKKLNISIHKKSSSQSVDDKRSQTQKPTHEKSKPKGIVLKKHLPNSSAFVVDSSEHKHKQHEYLTEISNLQKENQTLKSHLLQMTQHNFSSMNESNTLKPSNQNSIVSDDNAYKLIQRKYNLMKQKCLLLEGQIQKTIRKYIIAEERSKQLQTFIQSSSNSSACKPYQGKVNVQIQNHITKPGLSLQDLATPQFRESKFSNNFFAKNNQNKEENHWNHNQFNHISIQQYRLNSDSHLFDTFEKNGKRKEMSIIEEKNDLQKNDLESNNFSRNNIERNDLSRNDVSRNDFSRQFNEIEDVSEIVCRNEEDLAIGDTFDL